VAVNAGTYTLTEVTQYGYTPLGVVCTGVLNVGNTVTLLPGQSATCTFTNQAVGGTIIVKKNADPASGVFSFTTTGTGYTNFTINGGPTTGQTNTQSGLNAGTYSVQEGTQLGWTLTAIGGSGDANNPGTCLVTGSGGSSSSSDAAGT